MPQLDDMALYAAVVRAGGFTAAARKLELPLSTLSRRIALLEQSLGTKLLERTTRSLKMTEAGRVYYEHCRQLVEQAEEADRALQRLKQEPSGHLRMALPFTVDQNWATMLLSGFMAKYPKITVEVILKTDGIDPDEEAMDVLFDYGERPQTHHPVTPLGSTRMALYASPRYLQQAGVPKTPDDLARHDMVRFDGLPWPEFAPPELRSLQPAYRMTSNELLMARLVCINGFGIGWFPVLACQRQVHEGELVPVMPEYTHPVPLWLIHRSASRSTPKVALLVEHLAGLLGVAGAWDALERGKW